MKQSKSSRPVLKGQNEKAPSDTRKGRWSDLKGEGKKAPKKGDRDKVGERVDGNPFARAAKAAG